MKVTVDSKKGLKTILKVFIDKKTIAEKIDSRLDELKKTINLKGFRPGKVPKNILKQQFGEAAYGEALEKILRERINLGLDIGTADVLSEFSKETKPRNFSFSLGSDLLKNMLSFKESRNNIFKILIKSDFAKNIIFDVANKGLRF